MTCCRSDCAATARHFNADIAHGDRERYQRKGPDKRARLLLAGLTRAGTTGASILDVGSGIGMITFELLKRGAATATLAEASPAYLDAAREEAARRGLADRLQFALGDFVDTAPQVGPADVVVLDRAVCCYPDWRPLLEAAARSCRRALGLTYPRQRVDIRLVLGFENLRRRVSGDAFRAFVHSPSAMDAVLRGAGLHRVSHAGTFSWSIDVYLRN